MRKGALLFLSLLAGTVLYGQLIPYREGKKWGFKSYETQEIVILPRYKSVGEFSGSLAAFQKGRKFGYLNASGEEVIKPVYQSAGPFICGTIAEVIYKGKAIRINTAGHEVNGRPIDCGMYSFLSHGEILKAADGKQGYALCCPISDTLVPPEYDDLIPANHDNQLKSLLFIVRKEGRWGIVDTANKVVLPFEYDTIIPSRPDRRILFLGKDNMYGAYVLQTRFLIAPQYISVLTFANYIKVEICPGVYGYIDDRGRKYWK